MREHDAQAEGKTALAAPPPVSPVRRRLSETIHMLKTLAIASIAVSLMAGPALAADSATSTPTGAMSAPTSSVPLTAAQKKAELKAEKAKKAELKAEKAKEKKMAMKEKLKKDKATTTTIN